MESLFALGAALVGLTTCLYGYRLFKVMLALWGFVLGAMVASEFALRAGLTRVVAVAAGVVCGIVVAGVAELLYMVGVFLAGALFGWVGAGMVAGAIGAELNPLLALLVAALVGMIALGFQKAIIIFSTSFNGAAATIAGVEALRGHGGALEDLSRAAQGRQLLARAALGLAGVIVQYAITSKGVHHGPPPPPKK